MGVYVYIDGFNLYHGSLKPKPNLKWLDLAELCRLLLPGLTIDLIRYFTARVMDFPHDPHAAARQDVYIRALNTLPNVKVHDDGWFASRSTRLPKFPLEYLPKHVWPPTGPPETVVVQRLEEKRTDVNIASFLLLDCFNQRFDEAAVISNDGDLATPIQMVRDEFHKRIGVINPHKPNKISGGLISASSYHIRKINPSVLVASQLPPTLVDAAGTTIVKPPSWS